jgi:hypothetical protein
VHRWLASALVAAGALASSGCLRVAFTVANHGQAPADATAASPWQGLGRTELSALVSDDAQRRLATEGEPGFDAARVADYVAHPDQSPALSGKRCDRLLDLAVVALANHALDEAEGIVRLVRARARNRNMVFAGTTVLAEVARQRAGDDGAAQQRAVEAVLRELPRARFGAATISGTRSSTCCAAGCPSASGGCTRSTSAAGTRRARWPAATWWAS